MRRLGIGLLAVLLAALLLHQQTSARFAAVPEIVELFFCPPVGGCMNALFYREQVDVVAHAGRLDVLPSGWWGARVGNCEECEIEDPQPPPHPQPVDGGGGGCGDERDTLAAEYEKFPSAGITPACTQFDGSGGSQHFTWSELNGGFSNGNPHSPFGMYDACALSGLEMTRSNYNRGGIRLSSGYRCPHGNNGIPGASPTSLHMRGLAADMYSYDHPWTEDEFNRLRQAAVDTGFTAEAFTWSTYSDRHLHVAWS